MKNITITVAIAIVFLVLYIALKTLWTDLPLYVNAISGLLLVIAFLVAYYKNPLSYFGNEEVSKHISKKPVANMYLLMTRLLNAIFVINILFGHYKVSINVVSIVLAFVFAIAIRVIVTKSK